MSKNKTNKDWKRIIEKQVSSGLPVKQYCQQYHIPESTMYKMQKELQMTHDTRLFLSIEVQLSSPDILLHVVINDIPMLP